MLKDIEDLIKSMSHVISVSTARRCQ